MLSVIVNNGSLVSGALESRLRAHAHEIVTFRLPEGADDATSTADRFEQFAGSGRSCSNVFVDLTDSCNEMEEFSVDPELARVRVERRLCEVLKVLKYGAGHMARADGGSIWVLCFDHSVSFSVSTPSNPITNYAAMAAVQSIAKEVERFDVRVNLFMIHPPREYVETAQWRRARKNLHVYGLKYKPQPAEHIAETLHMYAELKTPTTTGGVIPLGSGMAVCNF